MAMVQKCPENHWPDMDMDDFFWFHVSRKRSVQLGHIRRRKNGQVCLGSELLLRAMSQGDGNDWLEFVHLPSRRGKRPGGLGGLQGGPMTHVFGNSNTLDVHDLQ